ncbi:MAG: hypothetical protein JSS07_04120 [Proteobacteria bacterium]|nr:hypothetical protein [Pseudomonadota bacterium]
MQSNLQSGTNTEALFYWLGELGNKLVQLIYPSQSSLNPSSNSNPTCQPQESPQDTHLRNTSLYLTAFCLVTAGAGACALGAWKAERDKKAIDEKLRKEKEMSAAASKKNNVRL